MTAALLRHVLRMLPLFDIDYCTSSLASFNNLLPLLEAKTGVLHRQYALHALVECCEHGQTCCKGYHACRQVEHCAWYLQHAAREGGLSINCLAPPDSITVNSGY